MPEGRDDVGGRYATAAGTLRSAARWLLAALAGVGAVLVGGLQLTGLGKLDSHGGPRLAVALVALAGVVAAIGYLIREVAAILTDEWVTLAHFDDRLFDTMLHQGRVQEKDRAELVEISRRIDDIREELYGYAARTVALLHRNLREANENTVRLAADPDATAPQRADALDRANRLRSAAQEVVDYANYERTRRSFNRLKARLAGGSIAVVVFVTVFAIAVNPPQTDKPVRIELTTTSTSRLSGVGPSTTIRAGTKPPITPPGTTRRS